MGVISQMDQINRLKGELLKVYYEKNTIRLETLEECARLSESVSPYCDHEPEIGAGAMGAIIRYRDAIRGLAAQQTEAK